MCKSTLCVWHDWLVQVMRQYQKCVMWRRNVTESSRCCNHYCWGLRPHCNALQHICYALLHSVTHTATRCNTYCDTHCNTLQHILWHTLQHAATHIVTHTATYDRELCWRCIACCGGLRPHCNTLQRITTHCYTVTHINTPQHMTELCRCCIARCRGLKLPSFDALLHTVC